MTQPAPDFFADAEGVVYLPGDAEDIWSQAAIEGRVQGGPPPARIPQLYLDMDGVLADFDRSASLLLGQDNYKFEFQYGTEEFWRRLNQDDFFFSTFSPMEDGIFLFEEVRHLDPVILTALPKENAGKVDAQKRAWIKQWLGADVRVITCRTHEKADYCNPGDILVDDRRINESAWKRQGGIFIHHLNAEATLSTLRTLDVL